MKIRIFYILYILKGDLHVEIIKILNIYVGKLDYNYLNIRHLFQDENNVLFVI